MSDSYSNWMSSLNLLVNNEDGEERSYEPFINNRLFGSRLVSLPNVLAIPHPLAKMYQNIPAYGMGPLTDDQKREIARRNNTFGTTVTERGNQQEEAQPNNNE